MLNQNAKVQIESDAVVFDSDLSTGDKVNIAKVMTSEDLRLSNRLSSETAKLRHSTTKVVPKVRGIGSTLC